MKLKNLLLSCALFITSISISHAQDVHYTMWDMSPLIVNPALTGAYSGTFRVGGIYRDQWRSILNNSINSSPYVTPSFYVDAPLIRGFGKNDWVGVGGVLFSDKAGTLDLTYSGFMGSVAYHLGLNKNGTSVLTLGAQVGRKQRSINIDNAEFADELSGSISTSPDRGKVASGDQNNPSFTDFSGGILFKSALNKSMDMSLGFAVHHVTEPEYALFNGQDLDDKGKPFLTAAHGKFNIGMNDKWTLSPSFFFQSTQSANEISVQAWNSFEMNEKYSLRGGLGYRLSDALQVLLGVDYKDLRVTAAYDVNISDLNEATNTVGGFEIAAWYIVKIYKKPEIKPAILCPKL